MAAEGEGEMKRDLQQASDDVGAIAEEVETLGRLLDKFHAEHGSEMYERLERAFPDASAFGGSAAKGLYKLASDLAPPDEHPSVDRALLEFVMFGKRGRSRG
jgi:hypothetical protein